MVALVCFVTPPPPHPLHIISPTSQGWLQITGPQISALLASRLAAARLVYLARLV